MMDGEDRKMLPVFDAAAKKSLSVDVERYEHMLEGLPEAQRREVLEALWSIIMTFVEMGYGVHPLQEVCGKADNLRDEWSLPAVDAVYSPDLNEQENPNDMPEPE